MHTPPVQYKTHGHEFSAFITGRYGVIHGIAFTITRGPAGCILISRISPGTKFAHFHVLAVPEDTLIRTVTCSKHASHSTMRLIKSGGICCCAMVPNEITQAGNEEPERNNKTLTSSFYMLSGIFFSAFVSWHQKNRADPLCLGNF